MPNTAKYLNLVKCNRSRAINLLKQIIFQLRNIYNDNQGYFFYFGYCDDIENFYNREDVYHFNFKMSLVKSQVKVFNQVKLTSATRQRSSIWEAIGSTDRELLRTIRKHRLQRWFYSSFHSPRVFMLTKFY